MKLEERMVSSQTIFEGHIIKVTLDQAELPNGKLAGREGVYHPGGVCVLALDEDGSVPLVRQFRYPINAYVYEFPAGLVEPGEEMAEAGIREIYEETGLTFVPRKADEAYSKPFFTTVGMTDESCGTIYGYCSGTPSNAHQEDSEDIQIVLADREECRRILKEENVAIMCAYMLMHFINSEGGDPLDFLDGI